MLQNQPEAARDLPEELFTHLTIGANNYFLAVVKEYAGRLKAEALNIERMEHVGDGPAEITTGHIEEAKWVLIRRLRTKALVSKKLFLPRIIQYVSTFLIGIGGSNFNENWGSILTIISLAIGFIAYFVEQEFSREY
jgi:hypothetical protein